MMKRLEIYRNDNYVLNDAFDQAVMNLHILKKQNGYKSFLICGCEAGNGTTTVAINLAAALASSGWKTVLIDGDMRKKNRYKRLNENVSEGLSDYLMDRVSLDQVICETTTENLSYIPCGELIDNPVRLLCSNKMNVARNELADTYDFIIYDMPAINAAMDAKVIAVNVDATILVSAIGDTTKRGLVDAANALTEVKANLIGTIVNKLEMDEYVASNADYDYFQNERYAKKLSKKNK
ncbi:CpsD/CapB family tyrosine-protein kinase [Pseudobutyrivibrio xylanivorans]|uniref:non-specific protein-tyrosine kinase n=1 Tax=Pseudobutyrivibrio xylanivorans TaxID=185007 RepID=A0A5P6VMX3_PSEXY|nr:CpsD/CapB family tyrosine-protein kinase [Pseudobutyrivibrio xylanivorans]QFJ53917.1 CpsD/CapB family tyrosine-protein kinase [Pseudobutyrivibrio xylanivorans]